MAGDKPTMLDLWPTKMLRHRLPGADQANPVLADEILALEAGKADLTTDYLNGNLLTHEHPAVQWLRSCLDRSVLDYARAAGIDYELEWHLQAWANINRFGDYHNLHNHPHAWLSGTYYVAVPDRPKDLPGRGDRNPGAISFFDPRPQANMLAVRGDPQVDPELRILPKPGEVLLWPAFLHHLVHPNLSEDLRISISFNAILRWKDEYLP